MPNNVSHISLFQSSDYRNEDSYSKDFDYEYNERKSYRSHNEHRNKEHRDRRSRSRSHERDYRSHDYDSGKNYDRINDKVDDRDRFKEKKEVPNNTLMIRNLPLDITDKEVIILF